MNQTQEITIKKTMTKNIGNILKEEFGKSLLHRVEDLNRIFTPLSFRERIEILYDYFAEKDVLLTSSFGTKSVFLLHLVNQIRPNQRVHFINTTF